eukprot:TRINITY_DN39374_c0_g1_i1.p1 TRINITY_DN39374_c0_g1~~TRINITY_DN39374_c0_g1_i1.p1  ORF type:complete len:394 (-),score=47.00 TRINITY_DN39374_c0_g1_i1:31-1212(-)
MNWFCRGIPIGGRTRKHRFACRCVIQFVCIFTTTILLQENISRNFVARSSLLPKHGTALWTESFHFKKMYQQISTRGCLAQFGQRCIYSAQHLRSRTQCIHQAMQPERNNGFYLSVNEGPLHDLLGRGSFRLVKGSYFQQQFQQGRLIGNRSEIPEDYFWNPEEALSLWKQHKELFFLVVSHAWMTKSHPDPNGYHLAQLAKLIQEYKASKLDYMRLNEVDDVGVFMDWTSLASRKKRPTKKVLHYLDVLYGHSCTTVFKLDGVEGDCLPTSRRGWPFFEHKCADLKDRSFGKVFALGEEKGLRSLREAAHFNKAPVTPSRFEGLLRTKIFNNPYEDPKYVASCYKALFEARSDFIDFRLSNCSWDAQDFADLEDVTSLCSSCSVEWREKESF